MTYEEERFVHFVSCIKNLNNAWIIMQGIKSQKDSSIIVGAAFQFALIEYSKPYKRSKGTVINPKPNCKGKLVPYEYKLDFNDYKRYIPEHYHNLHERIIKDRDKIHAHSDLTVMEAKLYVTNTPHENIVSILQNTIYGTEEISNIDTIIDLIEKTLVTMYEKEKLLEQQLPAKSWVGVRIRA